MAFTSNIKGEKSMIKVEVIGKFTLEDYKKLKNVKKVTNRKENEFDVKDTFECDEKMVDYLTGNNALNKVVVKVIEVNPEKVTVEKIIESAKDDAVTESKKNKKEKSSKK